MKLESITQSIVSQKEKNKILYINAYIWNLGGFPSSSACKESACNAGDHGSIPGSGRSLEERIGYPLQYSQVPPLPGGSNGKESACNVEDLGSVPELGRSPGGGHVNPLQNSCLENPHGQRSLAGYSPWGHKELDMTE